MEEKKGKLDYIPVYATFPLANSEKIIRESNVSIPLEDDIVEVKEWVDFKEM
ncbi:MAG: CDIF630_02480 family spore surface protein [Anaerovoracaceae bacterium]|jgi:hypothetical protein|nr:DUF3787 domain-containing protein [Clostridiales bacterium]